MEPPKAKAAKSPPPHPPKTKPPKKALTKGTPQTFSVRSNFGYSRPQKKFTTQISLGENLAPAPPPFAATSLPPMELARSRSGNPNFGTKKTNNLTLRLFGTALPPSSPRRR